MSKFDEFVADVTAKGGVDVDGAYGKQCMDLYNYYSSYMFGAGNVGANYAKNVLNNQNVYNYYDRIDNYLEFIPQKGDVAVWTGGQYGHVAICLGPADIKGFKTLDQNWLPQQLSEVWHDYTYMAPLVFLRPKDQSKFEDYHESKTFNVRIDKDAANVRTEPNTTSGFVKQPSGECYLVRGDVFESVGTVEGENVSGNNIWYKSKKGNYVWSGGLTKI